MAKKEQWAQSLSEQKEIVSFRITKEIIKLKKKNDELEIHNASLQTKIQQLEKKKNKNNRRKEKQDKKIDSLEDALKRLNK